MTGRGGLALRGRAELVVLDVARACAAAGGRLLVVGGWVRDRVQAGIHGARASAPGSPRSGSPTEIDLEVQGLGPESLERVLSRFGTVRVVGRAFPVFRVGGLPIEVALPRRGSWREVATREGDLWAGFDSELGFAEAALGRDLRVNAMGWDPLTGEVLDPHDGAADLAARVLRATCATRFGEDPLRGLRTAQLAARLELEPDGELLALCARTDLSGVAPERQFGEWSKLLCGAREPSRGLSLLRETGLLRFFPELDALVDVPQDPRWHPEGDVFSHTLQVVDAAAAKRPRGEDDLALMFGALCHDFGKSETTQIEVGDDGGTTTESRLHSRAGLSPTSSFLERLRAPKRLERAVEALVLYHLAPREFVRALPGAGPRAYRRLARALRAAGVPIDLLVRLARADYAGRVVAGGVRPVEFPNEALFVERALRADRERVTHVDIVKGRHALARGIAPGRALGDLLARCREIQEDTGWSDPGQILDRALEGAEPAEHGAG